MAPKKQVPAKKTTALVPWDEKFAAAAKASVDKEKNLGGSMSLKFSPGDITYNGASMPDAKVQVIILESAFLNAWFKTTYNPDSPTSPDCFALALDDADLAPSDKSADPQAETCATCPQNAWGSAATGRGKACGNKRRLVLLLASDCDSGEGVASAEMATALVSPTTLKAWAGYIRGIASTHNRPPWAVVTEIENVLDKGQTPSFHIEFHLVELVEDNDVLTALEKRLPAAQEEALRPYEPTPEPVAKPRGAVGKNNKFAAAKAAPVTKAPAGRTRR